MIKEGNILGYGRGRSRRDPRSPRFSESFRKPSRPGLPGPIKMEMPEQETTPRPAAGAPPAAEPVIEEKGSSPPPTWRDPREVLRKYPNIEKILGLELPVIVVLAETATTLEEILSLNEGSVIVFKKHNSEPLDILINNRKIGTGKTLMIGEHFGVHLRDVGTQREILAKVQ